MNFKERSPRRMLMMPGKQARVAADPINFTTACWIWPLVLGLWSWVFGLGTLSDSSEIQGQRPKASLLRIRDREITFFTADEQSRQATRRSDFYFDVVPFTVILKVWRTVAA